MELQDTLPGKWDVVADVVVVGFGAAGAATAITAHDAGARVLILEKAPRGARGGQYSCGSAGLSQCHAS